MKHRSFYYSCVPKPDREGQAEEFRTLGAQETEIFIDTMQGKGAERGKLRVLKRAALRTGDTLVIPTLYCLGDSKQGIQNELIWLRDHQIRIKIIDIPVTMRDLPEQQDWASRLVNEILVVLYSAVALGNRPRSHEKPDKPQEDVVRRGRPPMDRGPQFELLKEQWESGEISLREAARQLGVTHRTFGKWVMEEK